MINKKDCQINKFLDNAQKIYLTRARKFLSVSCFLTIASVLLVAGLFLVGSSSHKEVNYSGKQRMLSTKIVLNAYEEKDQKETLILFQEGIKLSGLANNNILRNLFGEDFNREDLINVSNIFINMANHPGITKKELSKYQREQVLPKWNEYTSLISTQYKILENISLWILIIFAIVSVLMKNSVCQFVIKPAINKLGELKISNLTLEEDSNNKEDYIRKNSRFVAQGENLSHINHNINNLLAIVNSYSNLMIKYLPDNDEKLEKIKIRYKEGMKNLIELSKALRELVIGGEVKENISLKEILDNIKILLNDKAKSTNSKIHISINKDIKIFGIKNEIYQVFFNLISNALDEKCIEHEDNWVNITMIEKEDSFYVDITDSGNGIDKNSQKLLFNSFHTTKFDGTGLGLVYVKKVLNNHMNSDIVYLDEKENTTFRIILNKNGIRNAS